VQQIAGTVPENMNVTSVLRTINISIVAILPTQNRAKMFDNSERRLDTSPFLIIIDTMKALSRLNNITAFCII